MALTRGHSAPVGARTAPDRCGALDVADAGHVPTGELPDDVVAALRRAAFTSPAYDGPADGPVGGPVGGSAESGHRGIAFGATTVAKVPHRAHERLGTVRRLEWLRRYAGIPAPRLLDHAGFASGGWWAVLSHVPGSAAVEPTPARQRALGVRLRAWHEAAPSGGLRLDDPGGLGVLLGTPREFVPDAYAELAQQYAEACAGQPMTPVHGDVAVCHNSLWHGEQLAAVLDSGAVEYAPPMLDLAWALAVDLPHGGAIDPLLDGYGRDAVDEDALHHLLPLLMLRRLVDVRRIGAAAVRADWLIAWLRPTAPHLLTHLTSALLP